MSSNGHGGKLTLQGREVTFTTGETLLDVARREGIEIPTLCHDPRLDPAGACRTCLVEVEGWRRMPPACATKAADGMLVSAESERIERHRKTLLSLYLTDHPTDRAASERGAPDLLLDMVEQYGAPSDWGRMPLLRGGMVALRRPLLLLPRARLLHSSRPTRGTHTPGPGRPPAAVGIAGGHLPAWVPCAGSGLKGPVRARLALRWEVSGGELRSLQPMPHVPQPILPRAQRLRQARM